MPSDRSLIDQLTQNVLSLSAQHITQEHIQALKMASPFAYQIWKNKPAICQNFLTSYPLGELLTRQQICDLIDDYTLDDGLEGELKRADEAGVMKGLRRLRELLMLRWIWQDALGLIALEQLTGELSDFADNCLIFVKEYVWEQLVARYGRPTYIDEKGQRQFDDMAIFAMGKLGAQELNLSSDIDLIFVHRARGETDGDKSKGTKSIDNKRFMIRLGQSIIKILDTCTAEGFVFRVDMRLRPWGEGSDLAIHLSALEKYFAAHGRAWERFAWLKARVINEVDDRFNSQLESIIKPFVFRYYVDYSAFAALREMKSLIQNQVAQREDLDNVKLGAGGIRDIEFVVQAFQLIYGGRHSQLEVKSCLKAMQALNEFDFIDDDTYHNLEAAYRFFRRVEHGIQAIHDQQTQKLPHNPECQHNLALTLGFDNWDAFLQRLNEHRRNVHLPFDRMVTERQTPTNTAVASSDELQSLDEVLNEDNKAKLEQFWSSKMVANLSEEAKQRLDAAYPVLVHALLIHEAKQGLANVALPRLIDLLEAICRRSIYLVMLAENPDATVNLIPMLSASPWIAGELTRYPVLLDSFLQQRYRHLPDKEELANILRQRLLRVEPNDEEMLLNVLRLFKNNQVLAVAASDVLAERPIMKVSDSLTYIAEVVLEFTLERAFSELVKRHGYPINMQGESVTEAHNGFAIIGYGKLGGIEMSYTSDLDLVFIHQINEQAMTTGLKPVSGMKFTARLAQKLMTYLNTQTRDGRAYEIDMRLRPSGNAGMMVVSSRSFERYQLEKAWVWEHQALVRARAICGDSRVIQAFNHTRKQVLTRKCDIADLKQHVIEMRGKMKDHLGSNPLAQQQGEFHLKQDAGGIVDIEFMAQYGVLAHAHDHPELAQWSDNVRIFESLAAAGVWDAETCEGLTKAYLLLRAAMHQLALANESVVVDAAVWNETREYVISKWNEIVV
ncbi:bifunctional [glutamate--ammonia ligase]-adenylyl-L-tyrosine phosphorylase/[glutamate--ammonia-ligase] adenylyltransferase [Psychrobacter sp. YP14]|uniref:bifunctional [glutamate--ammonia ligase]-adenylyl-L-tyrosine phosphorylase/[glutamate--ammonia-ligase] adenylyltransferase n=1 Tax=Psychrobacter sp. YP14 TaxID=2203895 RepID=UPI000D7E10F0|nr:bifunctional [glutamate--ammonia ligase]-adenylyl-L-tyrosine phosphorylase/[glutamate--ammonia-ligase] adenylyltransferase [Psychrobacter sp. YP14]AWT48943.1 bifunctional [glutamate--ammonia ligase]-adenylyl-L-tyrosine phosphorylase/[glutamate--ammonia-ligase] adenylyltransferase [Psychrobacter sp. YP14]